MSPLLHLLIHLLHLWPRTLRQPSRHSSLPDDWHRCRHHFWHRHIQASWSWWTCESNMFSGGGILSAYACSDRAVNRWLLGPIFFFFFFSLGFSACGSNRLSKRASFSGFSASAWEVNLLVFKALPGSGFSACGSNKGVLLSGFFCSAWGRNRLLKSALSLPGSNKPTETTEWI